MASALDMTLDDIIKTNKKKPSSIGGGGRGRRNKPVGASGPARQNFKRSGKRTAPFSKAPDAAWQHDMFTDDHPAKTARISSIETGTKLYISNLDYGVSNDDIKELFAEIGDLKRFSINYDKSGRSKGTAEVVYARRNDAMAAVKRYHNVQLDGKPMKIEIIGTNISKPAPVAPKSGGLGGASRSRAPRRGGPGPARRGGKFGNATRGRGKGGETKKVVSAEDLDKDLASYHNEAMQIN